MLSTYVPLRFQRTGLLRETRTREEKVRVVIEDGLSILVGDQTRRKESNNSLGRQAQAQDRHGTYRAQAQARWKTGREDLLVIPGQDRGEEG